MKVLLLTKYSEVEDFLFHFAGKINRKIPIQVDLLHVINSYPQVPLKKDGTIIDHCVDYDLSALYTQQKEEQVIAEKFKEKYDFIRSVESPIGHLERVVKDKILKEEYDFIFMGAHQTSLFEDLTHETTVSRIMELTDIPVLSMKCDQSHHEGIEHIGIFDDFKNTARIRSLSKLISGLGAKAHLYYLSESELEENQKRDVEQKIHEFAANNAFDQYEIHCICLNGMNEEEMIYECIDEDNLQLVSITHLNRIRINWLFNKTLKSSIADHVFSPLLIY